MRKLDISFGKIADQLFAYICSQYQPGELFPYPLQQGQRGTLLGSVFAGLIAHMLGKVQQLPGKQTIVEAISRLRNPQTGLFVDPYIETSHFLNPNIHSELYVTLQTTYFCHASLHALGDETYLSVPWLAPLLDEETLVRWLEELDWSNPWLVSNLDMFVGIFLLQWQTAEKDNAKVNKAVDAYFGWHDRNQVPQTGFWGCQDDLLNAMAGAYHIFIHYDYAGRIIHHLEQIIDATLRLTCRDGLFVYGGGGGSCEDMDAIDILVRCSLITDYRNEDVRKTLIKAAAALSTGQGCDGGFSWRIQPRIRDLLGGAQGNILLGGKLHNLLYKMTHFSHYTSIHCYSSLQLYPFKVNKSDMWSSWFRPMALAFIAKRYPEVFTHSCHWNMPYWPGLGYTPFK